MCKVLFLVAETNQAKQKEFKNARVEKRNPDDKLFFLFGKEARCLKEIKRVTKKKKPDQIVIKMNDKDQEELLKLLKEELGLKLKPVSQDTFLVIEKQINATAA